MNRSFSLINVFLLYTILLSSLWLLSTFPFCHGEYGLILLILIPSFCATFSNVLVLFVLSPSFTNSYPLSTCIVFILNHNLFSSSFKNLLVSYVLFSLTIFSCLLTNLKFAWYCLSDLLFNILKRNHISSCANTFLLFNCHDRGSFPVFCFCNISYTT